VTGTVAEKADLSIVKSTVGSPEVGGTFRYELRVANAGPGRGGRDHRRVDDIALQGFIGVDDEGQRK
jgi:hypothetical protein